MLVLDKNLLIEICKEEILKGNSEVIKNDLYKKYNSKVFDKSSLDRFLFMVDDLPNMVDQHKSETYFYIFTGGGIDKLTYKSLLNLLLKTK